MIKIGDRYKNKFGIEFVVTGIAPNGGAFMDVAGSFAGLYSLKELKKMTLISEGEAPEKPATHAEEILAAMKARDWL